MTEQNQHNYEHVATQEMDDLTIYDKSNGDAWISAEEPWEIQQ